MGVYHFMGLGRSVGAVTAPLSYLAARYERDNAEDRAFFARSGEFNQPDHQKRGDIQALVLFTTPDIRQGQTKAEEYYYNDSGFSKGSKQSGGRAIPKVLHELLPKILQPLTQTSRDPNQPQQRTSIDIYWCDIERDNPALTFERVTKTLAAAKPSGGLGKEIWINLTGGTNIINTALQLSASLMGVSAYMYYVLVEDDQRKLVNHSVPVKDIGTERDTFWVEVPIVYSSFDKKHRDLLEALTTGSVPLSELYDFAKSNQFDLAGDTYDRRLQDFDRQYLKPLISQQLITRDNDILDIGTTWKRLERYYKVVEETNQQQMTLGELVKAEAWFHHESLPLDSR